MPLDHIGVKPKDGKLIAHSPMVKIFFTGYQFYCSVQGNPGVIVIAQKPYAYPELGGYLEVPRSIGRNLQAKSRWNGSPTLTMEEEGGGETAKLVKDKYNSLAKKHGLDNPEFHAKPLFKQGQTRETYKKELEEFRDFRTELLSRFYDDLAEAGVKSVTFGEPTAELNDDEILAEMAKRGLVTPQSNKAILSDEELLELLNNRGLLPKEPEEPKKKSTRKTATPNEKSKEAN